MADSLGIIEKIKERHKITLNDFQKAVYLNSLDGEDVFVCLERLVFGFISELFSLRNGGQDRRDGLNVKKMTIICVTLVILPLSSLMLEQASSLVDLGIDAKFIGKLQSDHVVKESVVQGKVELLLVTPKRR